MRLSLCLHIQICFGEYRNLERFGVYFHGPMETRALLLRRGNKF
jgi:hypothetical protein